MGKAVFVKLAKRHQIVDCSNIIFVGGLVPGECSVVDAFVIGTSQMGKYSGP